jgi:hypothetical protein
MYKAPGARKAFKYRQPPTPPLQPANRAQAQKEVEGLTQTVQGKRASDIEERFARALDGNERVEGYDFIVHQITGANLPGEAQLDFLVTSGGQQYAVQIDGEFAHKSAEQRAGDAVQDARLSEALGNVIAAPAPVAGIPINGLIARVPGLLLEDQAAADAIVEELFP